jgi:thiol-disulfide isomerase/thioredoxin
LNLAAGRAYVITFWASWCGPCLQELPIFSNLQKKVGTEQMQVIAVNIEDRQTFRKLRGPISELGLFPAYDPNSIARRAYGVNGIPHMVVIGRDGKISAVGTGYAEARLETYVEDFNRALAVATPSAKSKQ